jgi:hypothetical protein
VKISEWPAPREDVESLTDIPPEGRHDVSWLNRSEPSKKKNMNLVTDKCRRNKLPDVAYQGNLNNVWPMQETEPALKPRSSLEAIDLSQRPTFPEKDSV